MRSWKKGVEIPTPASYENVPDAEKVEKEVGVESHDPGSRDRRRGCQNGGGGGDHRAINLLLLLHL